MSKRVSPEEAQAWVEEYLKQQADIGFGKAIANMILEPPNPFDPEARRRPKTGFVLAASLLAFAAGWFVYFNIVR
jgi:hypothetical protein